MSHLRFTPDIFDEHAADRRGLDNEIDDDGPHMVVDAGNEQNNDSEIVGEGEGGELVGLEQAAILSTLARARDNRRPCPPMQAVDLDAPLVQQDVLGAALTAAPDAYPLLTALLQTHAAAGKPRIVRMDTEASYRRFRTQSSPERRALAARLAELEQKLQAHLADPAAHSPPPADDLAEAADLHAAVSALKDGTQIPLRMPRHFDGLLEAWHQGDMAATSMLLPRADGGRWVATASESLKRGELEAAKAAAEAGVPAAAIVGYLPAIGAALAAADAAKALASGATGPASLLRRPEAQAGAPFMVRLEPQGSPAVFALGELCWMCQAGDPQACAEWNRLAQDAPAPIRQAMAEILAVCKPPAPAPETALGGVSDFFKGLFDRIAQLFRTDNPVPAAPAAPAPKALPAKAA